MQVFQNQAKALVTDDFAVSGKIVDYTLEESHIFSRWPILLAQSVKRLFLSHKEKDI